MAKRRKKRAQGAGSKGASGSKGAAGGRHRQPASATPADAAVASLGETLRTHPVLLLLTGIFFLLYSGNYLATLALQLDPALTTGNTQLSATPVALTVFSIWTLAAGVGLMRRTEWGWWAAAILAQYQLWMNALRAVLSDVSIEPTLSSDVVLVTSVARLTLWVAVSLYLHSHGMASHYGLPWPREEERKRTHRVILYGVGLLVVLYLGNRYFGVPRAG